MGGQRLNMRRTVFVLYLLSSFTGFIACADKERLTILPEQEVQQNPVRELLMLTCRADVEDPSLLTDLKWRDNRNITIPPKSTERTHQPMYTEILPGNQSLALIIPSLTETMAGRYYCSASYASSQLLEIGVNSRPYVPIRWTNAPENQFPLLGSNYLVQCEAVGNPAPMMEWLRNGDKIKGDKYVVQMSGLAIRNVQEFDDGIYTCRAAVIETGEVVERNIRVEVLIKPEFKSFQANLEATEGYSFSTFCNATGKPVPQIEWIKDLTQQNVVNADRFHVNPQTGLLTITKVEQQDYGTYTCIAKNAAGLKAMKTKLGVLVRPKIVQFYNQTGMIRNEGSLTCHASGRPAPEVTFRYWGSEEEFTFDSQRNDDRIIIEQYRDNENGKGSATLRISKLMRSDDGLYECIARNRIATACKVGHIQVQFPPDLTYMRSVPPVYSWEEKQANLSCIAESIPNATIEWRWKGEVVRNLLDKNLVIEGGGPRSNLIVTPLEQKYYSTYHCHASNLYGTVEVGIQLKMGHLPSYIQSAIWRMVTPKSITFDILGPATEPGLPIIAYSVRYIDERSGDWSKAQRRNWSLDSPYILEGLRPKTSYIFQFAAQNQVGWGPWGVNKLFTTPRLTVPEEPRTFYSAVQNDEGEPVVMSPYSDHFDLSWSVPSDNGEPIDFYQIKYCSALKVNVEWSELGNECVSREVVETTSFEMSDLNANTFYRIELRAHNAIGFSTPAETMMKTARADNSKILPLS